MTDTRKKPQQNRGSPRDAHPSITELARRLGISRKSVTGHIERGTVPAACLQVGPHGQRVLVDADGAERAIRAALELRTDDAPDLDPSVDYEDPETWPRTLAGLRLVREWWVTRLAKRKDDTAAGELVRADEVYRSVFGALRLMRDHLLGLPDRAANDLAAELGVPDATAVRAALQASIERGLADLARALDQLRMSNAEVDDDEQESPA